MYVDDFTGLNKITPKGIRYDPERKMLVTFTQFLNDDEHTEDDVRTFTLFSSIANTIDLDSPEYEQTDCH